MHQTMDGQYIQHKRSELELPPTCSQGMIRLSEEKSRKKKSSSQVQNKLSTVFYQNVDKDCCQKEMGKGMIRSPMLKSLVDQGQGTCRNRQPRYCD
jgi:hypothetical protein